MILEVFDHLVRRGLVYQKIELLNFASQTGSEGHHFLARYSIRIRKRGVHFDLAHRNRIEWEQDKPQRCNQGVNLMSFGLHLRTG